MKRLSFLILALSLVPVPSLAQSAAPQAKKAAKVKFDPATVVTLTGMVIGEQRVNHGKGTQSVRLVLKIADDQVSVHLGPDTWVDRQKVKFEKGDEATVKGSKFTYEGNYGLIAQTVTRGSDSLVLRDATGKPAWARQVANQ